MAREEDERASSNYSFKSRKFHLPSQAARFHLVGERHIVRPHIKLPFSQAKHTAQYVTSVDANSHVDITPSRLPHKSTIIKLCAFAMSECRTEMEFKLKAKEIEKREKHKRLRLQKRFGNESTKRF